MVGRRKPRKEAADETQEMTFISLMLLLFCFMVIMVSLAQVQGPRFRSAIGSVRGAFSLLRSADQTNLISSGGPGVLTQSRGDIRKEAEKLRMALEQLLGKDAANLVRIDETEPGFSLTLGSLVLFDPGSAGLKQDAIPVMDEVARFLGDWPGGIRVTGHSDDMPIRTARYPSNWELSMARAVDIVRFFERSGLDGRRLLAEGRGASRPIVANDTPEHRAMNRRVEISLDCFTSGTAEEKKSGEAEDTWFSPTGPTRGHVFEVPGEEWTGPPSP
ncbi:MAG: OmpA family protein [Candidatus Eisenbacteria bacterium]